MVIKWCACSKLPRFTQNVRTQCYNYPPPHLRHPGDVCQNVEVIFLNWDPVLSSLTLCFPLIRVLNYWPVVVYGLVDYGRRKCPACEITWCDPARETAGGIWNSVNMQQAQFKVGDSVWSTDDDAETGSPSPAPRHLVFLLFHMKLLCWMNMALCRTSYLWLSFSLSFPVSHSAS